jgi:hypothetical protein
VEAKVRESIGRRKLICGDQYCFCSWRFAIRAHANVVQVGGGITVDCVLFGTNVPTDCGAPTLINPVTFSVPEGGATEPVVEYGLLMTFNVPFTKTGLTDMLDPTDASNQPCPLTNYPLSCISDQVSSVNVPATGNGSILFRSDPPPLINGIRFVRGDSVGCVQLALSGCTFSLNVGPVVLTFFSDGNFPLPSPSSDSVAITPTPEPASFVLFGLGAAGISCICGYGRKRLKVMPRVSKQFRN